MRTPAQARARLHTVLPARVRTFATLPGAEARNSPLALASYYGYVPEQYRERFEQDCTGEATYEPNTPLTTAELMSWDTWFWLHPEKVAGTEQITTSQQFPLTLKGSKEDIIRTIRAGMDRPQAATQPSDSFLESAPLPFRATYAKEQGAGYIWPKAVGGRLTANDIEKLRVWLALVDLHIVEHDNRRAVVVGAEDSISFLVERPGQQRNQAAAQQHLAREQEHRDKKGAQRLFVEEKAKIADWLFERLSYLKLLVQEQGQYYPAVKIIEFLEGGEAPNDALLTHHWIADIEGVIGRKLDTPEQQKNFRAGEFWKKLLSDYQHQSQQISTLNLMRLKAKAAKAKLLLQKQARGGLSGARTLHVRPPDKKCPRPGHGGHGGLAGLGALGSLLAGSGLAGLGNLHPATSAAVSTSALAVRAVLDRAKEERSYSATDKLGFDEVLRLYNPGITVTDIKAWVWFRRSIGVEMGGGWRKFYLTDQGTTGQLLTTTKTTTVLDNGWRTVASVPAGVVLGKPTKKSHEYRGVNYLIFRADDNALRFVDEKAVQVSEAKFSTDQADLDDLVRAGSLFYLRGEFLPFPMYAFGNMYDRELELQEDRDEIVSRYGLDVYELHETAIKSARPRLLSVQNPDPRERMRILAISEFAHEFRVASVREDVELKDDVFKNGQSASLYAVFTAWLLKLPGPDFREVTAEQIKRYYLEKGPLSKNLTDAQKQTIEMYAGPECEELFGRFLHDVLLREDQQKLDFTWNRTYNAQASVPYHRVPVGFECSARFKKGLLQFTPAQREAIAFMETTGSGVLAYDVGVGKTMSAIITLANALYAGKCQRPLIAVPNPTYAKWVKEIIGYTDPQTKEFVPRVLSNTGITVNEWYNLGADVPAAAQLLLGRVKVPARSITVVTYEGLAKIGLSQKALQVVGNELEDVLNQRSSGEKSARGREKKRQSAHEIVGGSNAGSIADLDVLGFDYLVVDEAHNFKNIFGQVPTDEDGKKRFEISGSESARGQKLFFLANYVQRRYGRNVLLLTATPFTNSPLEIYSMLSLVGYQTMVRMGLHNLEAFCETFILQGNEYANNYDGGIVLKPVVKRFNNRLVLQKLIFNHIAYKTGEEAGVQRPCKINLPRVAKVEASGQVRRLRPDEQTLTYLEMSPLQRSNQESILSILKYRDPKDFGAIFRVMAQNLDNALSPYLVPGTGLPASYRDYILDSPKLHYVMSCIASVKKWHEDRQEPVSGQIIYMNRGKEYFDYVRQWLTEEVGYRAQVKHNGRTFHEVEIISSGLSADKKEGIKEAFLAGVVKVLIGTATIREGIDLQTKCTVIYNCYPDWNPTDVKQLEGRGWRQGNEFGFIRVVMPLVQNSMDVFVFQKLEEKTSRVNDLWFRGDRGNVLDQESLDPEEVKFALYTDLRALVKLEIDRQVKDAKRRKEVVALDLKAMQEYGEDRALYLSKKDTLRDFLTVQLDANPTRTGDVHLAQLPPLLAGDTKPRWYGMLTDYGKEHYPGKVDRWLLKARAWLNSPEANDWDLKDLVLDARDLLASAQHWYFHQTQEVLNVWTGAWGKVAKAEKTFLKNRGMTASDDPADLINSLVAEADRLTVEIDYYQNDPEYMAKAMQEVQEKKARLHIIGTSSEERVAEFAALNHVLGYKFGQRDTCDIPTAPRELPAPAVQETPATPNPNLLLLRLKAKAAKAKLLLQAQARNRA